MNRLSLCLVVALTALIAAAGADGGPKIYAFPRFQPVSIAFLDELHGVLAEDDWVCQKTKGCTGRILVSSDGGLLWRTTYVGARGIHLYPVRGTPVVYALAGNKMIVSGDGGLHWHPASMPPSVVSFVSPTRGWRIGAVTSATRIAKPPPLEETTDGGRSWSDRTNPCRGDYGLTIALSFATSTRGWVVCLTQATAGYQDKEVWQTTDGGTHWQLEARAQPIAPPDPKQKVGTIAGFGYPTGIDFLRDGRGWLLQGRGNMLITSDGGHRWHAAQITKPDTIAAQSAELLNDKLDYVLLRGCNVQLDRTTDGGKSWTTVRVWKSPTQC